MATKKKQLKDKKKKKKTEKENFIEAGNEVVNERQKIMAKHGLDLSYFLRGIKELCEATKAVSCLSGKDADSKTVDFVDVPEWTARAKGIDTGLKLGSYYPKEELKVEVKTDIAEMLAAARARVKEMRK